MVLRPPPPDPDPTPLTTPPPSSTSTSTSDDSTSLLNLRLSQLHLLNLCPPSQPLLTPPLSASIPYKRRSMYDIIGDIAEDSSGPGTTPGISCSISVRQDDSSTTLKWEDKSGYSVIKLEIFEFKEARKTSKQNWWKTSPFRSIFVTNSLDDPVQEKAEELMNAMTRALKTKPNVERETKEIGSSNSFGRFQ